MAAAAGYHAEAKAEPAAKLGWTDGVLKLSAGNTYYQAWGLQKAQKQGWPVLVAVHGLSETSGKWAPLAQLLVPRGVAMVAFDGYGRGSSPWPKEAVATASLFVEQTVEVCKALSLERASFIGHSMGGAVVSLVAEQKPVLVDKLVLLAPAGLPVNKPILANLLHVPFLGELAMGMFGRAELLQSYKDGFYDKEHEDIPRLVEKAKRQFEATPGFSDYLLSVMRNFPMGDLEKTFAQLGGHARDVLLVWGTADTICPYENHKRMLDLMPRTAFVPLAQTGHELMNENKDKTLAAVTNFMAKK